MSTGIYATKRRAARFITHFTVAMITRIGENAVETPCQVVDFSGYGLTIASNQPVIPGQKVNIVPHEGPEHVVNCRVVWVHETKKVQGFHAGLEFENPLIPAGDQIDTTTLVPGGKAQRK